MNLWEKFEHGEKIGFDTSVLIYYINRHRPYFNHCRRLIGDIERGRLRGVVSIVSEMEVLVEPLARGRREIVKAIEHLLRRLVGLEIVPVDRAVARRAAELRAETRLRSIDALVATTATMAGCRYLVGNDREFARRVKGIDYLLLKDYL